MRKCYTKGCKIKKNIKSNVKKLYALILRYGSVEVASRELSALTVGDTLSRCI